MFVKESNFKKFEMNVFCKIVMQRNVFSLKHPRWLLATYCGQSLAGLRLFTEVRYRISKKSVVKTLLNIFLTVKKELPNV